MSGGGSSTTSKTEIPEEAKPYLYGNGSTAGVLPEAGRIYGEQSAVGPYQDQQMAMMNPVQDYGYMRQSQVGDQMAGMSQDAMNMLGAMGGNLFSGGGAAYGGGGGGIGGGGSSYKGNYQDNIDSILGMDYKNPHLEETIQNTQDSASRAYERNVAPQLRGNAIGAGQYGSSRDYIAQGLAGGDLARHMTDTAANQYGQAYNQAYNAMTGLTGQLSGQASSEAMNNTNASVSAANSQRQYDLGMRNLGLSAINSIGGLGNMGLQGSQAIQGAGAPYQSQEQGLYDLGRSNEMASRQFQQGLLNNYAGTVIPGAGMGQSQTQQNDPGALGTLGMLGNLGLGFLAL